jgi:hypothetical protein
MDNPNVWVVPDRLPCVTDGFVLVNGTNPNVWVIQTADAENK